MRRLYSTTPIIFGMVKYVMRNAPINNATAVSRKYNFYLDYNLSNIILKKNFTKLTCLETLVGSFSNL